MNEERPLCARAAASAQLAASIRKPASERRGWGLSEGPTAGPNKLELGAPTTWPPSLPPLAGYRGGGRAPRIAPGSTVVVAPRQPAARAAPPVPYCWQLFKAGQRQPGCGGDWPPWWGTSTARVWWCQVSGVAFSCWPAVGERWGRQAPGNYASGGEAGRAAPPCFLCLLHKLYAGTQRTCGANGACKPQGSPAGR